MAHSIDDLRYLMQRLRDPDTGCPWDLRQDFASIVPHTLEESYELADAIERGDREQIRQELGDVLFQVIFYSQLAEEEQSFGFAEVVDDVVEKLLRRHPHVFPDGRLRGAGGAGPTATEEGQVKRNWELIKQRERADKAQHGVLDDVPLALPALSRAAKLQKRAAQVKFDWDDTGGVLAKLREELDELEEAVTSGCDSGIEDELGDLLFSCVNLARHLKVEPETALRRASHKFERRFRYIETELKRSCSSPRDADIDTMNALWQQAKLEER